MREERVNLQRVRKDLTQLIARVRSGERIILTRYGRPVIELTVPPEALEETSGANDSAGVA